mgnify:CR=1 FL=1
MYLRPPKEANTNNIWHLKKCVYGLADACRYWYLQVKEVLTSPKGNICPSDQGIFTWYEENSISGIITCFVDDIIWGGTESFYKNVVEKFKNTFKIGSESVECFTYLGINIKQRNDFSIEIDQSSYVDTITPIE